jgi:hypothetical protein
MRACLVSVLLLAGCSFGMKTTPSTWDGTTEPTCDESILPALGDALIAGGLTVTALEVNNETVSLVSLAGAILFGVASVVGEEHYRSCSRSKEAWQIGGAIGKGVAQSRSRPVTDPDLDAPGSHFFCARNGRCEADDEACGNDGCRDLPRAWCVAYRIDGGGDGFLCGVTRDVCLELRDDHANREGRHDFGECIVRTEALPLSAERRAAMRGRHSEDRPGKVDVAPTPRGFFCSSSQARPDVGLCTRQKADCASARELAAAGVPDLTDCQLLETAWCTDTTCGPSAVTCEGARARKGSNAAPCTELQ